jgi:hypothetical protein
MSRSSDVRFQVLAGAAAVIFCLTTGGARAAKDVPTITVSKGDQINLAISPLGGGDGAAATKIVQNDLTLSGYFILGGANSLHRGSAGGSDLRGQVVDHSGGTVLSKAILKHARECTIR